MKIKPIMVLFLFFLCPLLGAQTIHEPNNDMYRDIERWAVQGYIEEFLPLIRPYPAPLIDKILNMVIDNGDADAREKAAAYRDQLAPGSRIIHPGLFAYAQGKNSKYGFIGAPFAEGVFRIGSLLSASYHFGIYGFTDEDGERFNVPGTYTPYPDLISDTANIGPVELRPQWTSLVALGNEDIYLQAGLSRTSVGPFYDNGPIVGPQAPRAGHFSFVFWRPQWSFEMLFQSITATDDFGEGKFPDKYNILHIISYRPIKNLELGFVQAVIWGQRIEPLYLVPFSFLFASQSMSGFDDNSLMGLHVRWRPIDRFLVNGQVYVDDLSFNGLFSGDYKFKLAGQVGVSWAPKKSFLSKLDFDYTAVLPYMYSHWNSSDTKRYNRDGSTPPYNPLPDKQPNYLNYTHLGRNLGSELEPNSDRISVRTYWNTVPGVDLSLSVYLTRHGNASEGLEGLDPQNHDGSVFDDGSTDPWDPLSGGKVKHNPHNNMFFLTQDTLDIRLGGGIGIIWTIPSPIGVFRLSGEYGLQYGWNRNTVPGNNGLDHYWSIGGMWSW